MTTLDEDDDVGNEHVGGDTEHGVSENNENDVDEVWMDVVTSIRFVDFFFFCLIP